MGGPAYITNKNTKNIMVINEFDNFNMDYPFEYNNKEWDCAEQAY